MAKRLTDEQIAKALTDADGSITAAAEALGCTRQTIYNRMSKAEVIQAARDSARKAMVAIAEGKLYEAVKSGNLTAVIFFLKTQAGYRETNHQEQSGELTVRVVRE